MPIDLSDEIYARAGATILKTADEVFAAADMIVKVRNRKQPKSSALRPGQTLFTICIWRPIRNRPRVSSLPGFTAIAYETVTDSRGGLPLLPR